MNNTTQTKQLFSISSSLSPLLYLLFSISSSLSPLLYLLFSSSSSLAPLSLSIHM
jgi:hypothetical protein